MNTDEIANILKFCGWKLQLQTTEDNCWTGAIIQNDVTLPISGRDTCARLDRLMMCLAKEAVMHCDDTAKAFACISLGFPDLSFLKKDKYENY